MDYGGGSSAQGTSNCKRDGGKSHSIEYHNSCTQELVCGTDDFEQIFEPNIYYNNHIEDQGQHKLQQQLRKDEPDLDVNFDKVAYANPQIEYHTSKRTKMLPYTAAHPEFVNQEMAYEAKQKSTDYRHNPVGQPRRQERTSCLEDEEYGAIDSHKYFGQNKDSRKSTVSR